MGGIRKEGVSIMKKFIGRLLNTKDMIITVCTLFVALCVIGLMLLLAQDQGLSFSQLSRDVISVSKVHHFSGLFSNLGIILWGVAFVSYFWGAIYSRYGKRDLTNYRISLGFCLVAGLLYLDDYLMIHDIFVKYYMGWPEEVMMVLYAVLILIFIVIWYDQIAPHGLLLLIMSFGFLGLSAGFDFLDKTMEIENVHLYEDGSKFIGIMLWTIFSIRMTYHHLTKDKESDD